MIMGDQNDDCVNLLGNEKDKKTEEGLQAAEPKKDVPVVQVEEAANKFASANGAAIVTEKSAQGDTEKDDHTLQEKGSPISNIKIEVITFVDQKNEKENETNMKTKPTLLEQALTYRQQNPEKWQQSQVDGVRRVEESYGIYKDDPFIEAYYKRLAELKIEAEEMEEIRKTLVSIIIKMY